MHARQLNVTHRWAGGLLLPGQRHELGATTFRAVQVETLTMQTG